MRVETPTSLPVRHHYEHGDTLPAGVDLGATVGPWWTVTAVDPTWNHVATMGVQWRSDDPSDPAGPGGWEPVPGGQTRLIVCSYATGDRHPHLDRKAYPTAADAMRAAFDAGLLEVIVFPRLAPAPAPARTIADFRCTTHGARGCPTCNR